LEINTDKPESPNIT